MAEHTQLTDEEVATVVAKTLKDMEDKCPEILIQVLPVSLASLLVRQYRDTKEKRRELLAVIWKQVMDRIERFEKEEEDIHVGSPQN